MFSSAPSGKQIGVGGRLDLRADAPCGDQDLGGSAVRPRAQGQTGGHPGEAGLDEGRHNQQGGRGEEDPRGT